MLDASCSHFDSFAEPTKDRKVPDLKTSRTTAAWLVDSKFPAALGICDTRVPPTSQIRVRLDFMAVGPYEQEGPWMGVALDIPPGPPTEAAPGKLLPIYLQVMRLPESTVWAMALSSPSLFSPSLSSHHWRSVEAVESHCLY